jgi:hypothetical protein
MKNICCFLFFILLTGYSFGQASDQAEKFKKLSWLTGTWNRTNVKTGRSAHERWEQTSAFELRGFGVSLQGKDTTFIEKLRITIKDNNIVYVADVPENQKPVYFILNQITDTGFNCENPDHDFPKKITYQREGKKLKAQISGDGKVIDFLFERE